MRFLWLGDSGSLCYNYLQRRRDFFFMAECYRRFARNDFRVCYTVMFKKQDWMKLCKVKRINKYFVSSIFSDQRARQTFLT